jgi:transposase
MNRLERVGETLRAALNILAVEAPEWLTSIADPEWFKRYGCSSPKLRSAVESST